MDGLRRFVEGKAFRGTVLGLILANAVLIGMETYPEVGRLFARQLHRADRAVLFLFTVELALRILASRPHRRFFASGWNWFDLLIVAAGYLPGAYVFTVLRLLRILRVLRAVAVIPDLQKLVTALLRTLPSLAYILVLMSVLVYVYAAIGTLLFRDIAPDHFPNLHRSMLTLFTVITLEGWVNVMDEVMAVKPYSWLYFTSFITLATFVGLNFLVGVIVQHLQGAAEEKTRVERAEMKETLDRLETRILRKGEMGGAPPGSAGAAPRSEPPAEPRP